MVKVWKVITNHSACRLCLYAPLPVLLSIIWLPIWRRKTGEAEHIFDRHKADMEVKINVPQWSLSPWALPMHCTSTYVCPHVGQRKRGSERTDYSYSHFHAGAWQKCQGTMWSKWFSQWRTWHSFPQIEGQFCQPGHKEDCGLSSGLTRCLNTPIILNIIDTALPQFWCRTN